MAALPAAAAFAFLIIFLLAFLGVLHGPSNYDGLAYREPRVLHWLAEETGPIRTFPPQHAGGRLRRW
jgi:hypothetical protein